MGVWAGVGVGGQSGRWGFAQRWASECGRRPQSPGSVK